MCILAQFAVQPEEFQIDTVGLGEANRDLYRVSDDTTGQRVGIEDDAIVGIECVDRVVAQSVVVDGKRILRKAGADVRVVFERKRSYDAVVVVGHYCFRVVA